MLVEPQVAPLGVGSWLEVTAPARLHFGLLNETGLYGRIDGGLGVAVAQPCWKYRLQRAPDCRVSGPLALELADSALAALHDICGQLSLPPLALDVVEAVPAHAGFGSKTSLLTSLASALFKLGGRSPTAQSIARAVGRGGTSGVGVYLSRGGGLVVDLGRRFPQEKNGFAPSSTSASDPPLLLTRLAGAPASIVHLRFTAEGPSGAEEQEVFAQACPVPASETMVMLARVLSQIVPAYLEQDLQTLQSGLDAIQNLGLKREEWAAQTHVTRAFRAHFTSLLPGLALCLSSMGPTMFVFTNDPARVLRAIGSFDVKPYHLTITSVADYGTCVQWFRG